MKYKSIGQWKMYAITSSPCKYSYEEQVRQFITGGADVVQLRTEGLSDRQFYALGGRLKKISAEFKIPLIINNRLDLALLLGAEGVHLGQADLPLPQARKIILRLKSELIIGVSCHSLPQALKAEKEGADYLSIGPVFATATKPGYEPVGWELIKRVKKKTGRPLVAIGGINQDNLKQVLGAGAGCVAVVRAISGDIRNSVKKLKKEINAYSNRNG